MWLALFIAVACGTTTMLAGDTSGGDEKDIDTGLLRKALEKDSDAAPYQIYQRGRWEFSLESGYMFQTIPNPFYVITEGFETNILHYRLATQILSVHYQLTNPCGPWLLRGVLEVNANLVGAAIVHGPEDYFLGFALGFRYYFVQPGARLVPYLEVRGGGPGATNSQGGRFEQQQDLVFTYMLGAGLRYDVNRYWSATFSVMDQHISDGYMTHPNYGFDAFGVVLGVVRRF